MKRIALSPELLSKLRELQEGHSSATKASRRSGISPSKVPHLPEELNIRCPPTNL